MKAGVAKDVVCLYATFWLLMRVAFIFLYAMNVHELIGALRSASWAFSLMASAKLLWLAAEKA
jgi:uncharacterized MAPEG superfamily protein